MAANAADQEQEALFEALEIVGFVNDPQAGGIPRPTEEFADYIGITSIADLVTTTPQDEAERYAKDYNRGENNTFRMQTAHIKKLCYLMYWAPAKMITFSEA